MLLVVLARIILFQCHGEVPLTPLRLAVVQHPAVTLETGSSESSRKETFKGRGLEALPSGDSLRCSNSWNSDVL